MKTIVRYGIISIFVFSVSFGVARAQAAPTTIQSQLDLIKQLLQQVQALQAQIDALSAQKKTLQQQTREEVTELADLLKEGSTGENVKVLQALLAADPELYPEGLITGYYGRLTAVAVKRFQKKHAFEQVGHVGPKTLKKLNEELKKHPIALENNEEEGEDKEHKRPCAIVPPGHLIASGWLRKHDNVRPIVPECQTLPPGIKKQMTGTSTPPTPPPPPPPPHTTTTDTLAPHVSFLTPAASTVSGIVTLTASASDNVGVVNVKYFCNISLIGEATSTPYSVPFDTQTCGEGSKTLSVKAYDAAGNVGEANILVTVANGILITLAAPGGDIWGVTWDGSNLWTGTPNGYLYRIDSLGNILNTLSVGTFNTGLAWDGANLWASYGNIVVRYNTDGIQQKLFEVPAALNWITGMAWDGSALWVIDRGAKKLYRINRTNGSIEETVSVAGNWLLLDGLDYHDSHFWATDAETDTLIKLTSGGVIVDTYNLPGATPVDIAFEGSYLWVADVDDNVLRKIDVSKLSP